MDLLVLAKVLWRKKWILILVPLIAAGAAHIFTLDMKNYYTSVSQISTGFTINDQVQLTDEKFNPRDADTKFNNLLQAMNSVIPLNLLSYRMLLHDIEGKEKPFRQPEDFKPTRDKVDRVVEILGTKLENFSPLSSTDTEYHLVQEFLHAYGYNYDNIKNSLKISRVDFTDYVEITYTSDDPYLSAKASNTFCDEFMRYYKSLRAERTGESVEFLRQIVSDKKKILDEKIETQKIFKSSNSLIDVHREGEAKFGQLQDLERLRDEISSRIQKLNLQIRGLKEDIRSLSTPGSTHNNQSLIDLRAKIARLNERYITTGSKNQVLLDSITMLREQLNIQSDIASRQMSPITPGLTLPELKYKLKEAEIDWQVENSNLSITESKIRNLQTMFSGFASKEASLDALQKEVELTQQEYLEAASKYNEAKNRMLSTNSLRQVLRAVPASQPESQQRLLIIALAGASSMAICFFVIVGLELIDVSVRTPDKFKRITGLPLIATLNRVDYRNFNIRSYFSQTLDNQEAEMFKSLLRKLRHELENMNGKVVLFTSPKKKEGKTFVIFSLAYVLSLINKRVLIIDTNFKNNSLSQLLVKPQTEIKVIEGRRVNLLIGSGKKGNGRAEENDDDGENTYDLINPTKYKNIFIVGNAGGGVDSPAEILSGRDFNNLIAVLVDSFDYILLEGAALNDYSDTKELVQYADKVVAVFSADASINQLDRESISYFKTLGKKFGGSILNRANTKDLTL